MSVAGEASRWTSKAAGTTLIETLVVLAITAMIGLIGFPSMERILLGVSQHQTISLVVTRLRQARAWALARDAPAVFAVSGNGRDYGVRPSGAAGGLDHPALGVTVSVAPGARREIVFYGDGSSSGGVIWVRTARRTEGVSVLPAGDAVVVGS